MAGRGKRKNMEDNGFGEWGGYMAAKISKLENQYLNEQFNEVQEDEKLSNIFSNVAIFVNGYTTPTAEELKRIMLANGGIYHHYYNSKTTTHIIASNLCEAKIKKLKGDEKFVRPEWIVESLEAKMLLDLKPYLLYTGLTLDKGQQKLDLATIPKKKNDGHNQTTIEKKIHSACAYSSEPVPPGDSNRNSREMKRAGEDDFLSEFYKRSRLHHISTMGALFKRHVTELREKHDGIFPGIENIEIWRSLSGCLGNYKPEDTVFMHIDMDCFFVSVGLRNYPHLVGKPVVVTHARADAKPLPRREGCNREYEFDCYKEHWIKKSKFSENNNTAGETVAEVSDVFPRLQDLDETCSMSEIASCSYEARAAGIYNGMFMGGALKLCSSLVAIPYDFEGYKEVSTMLYNTVATYTLDMEAVSCDELYADITSVLRQTGLTPDEFATHLKEVIFNKTKCNASVGMGPNMLMARLATKKAKPNGLFYINKKDMNEFMKNHKIEDLPGIGRSMAHRFHGMGVHTCTELQQVSLGKLQHEFGQKQGQTLYHMCRGEDKRALKTEHVRKSVSADINYGIRFANDQEMHKFVQELSIEVSKRMEEIHVRGKLLTLKLKIRAKDAPIETAKFMGHGVCDSISRSATLCSATRDTKIIEKEVQILLKQLKVDCCELRGMGIQFSKLVEDNVSKGKQPIQNSLLNFVARSRIIPQEEVVKTFPNVTELESETLAPAKRVDKEKKDDTKETEQPSTFELPSASQIDSVVFNELPDDLKNDIIQEYKRNGIYITLSGINSFAINPSTSTEISKTEVVYDSSLRILTSDSAGTSRNPVSYEEIDEVTDIDASYWSALPEDIKTEIERDIQQRKAEATSPIKGWKNLFKPQRSPAKSTGKLGGRKTNKAEVKRKTKAIVISKPKIHPPIRGPIDVPKEKKVVMPPEVTKEELALSGATTLPEIRELLVEWFSSTNDPENEDCEAVSSFLASLVNNRELHMIEPIILFLKRRGSDKNDSWKRAIENIINNTQLYVIQYYNAPLKLPSPIS